MKVVAFTGGHSFERDAFEVFLESLPCDTHWIEHPEAIDFVTSGGLDDVDVTLHYDMPGVRPEAKLPPSGYAERILDRTRSGHGFVVLHHAIGSWPLWPEWSELVGGQYLYRRGSVRGQAWPDSGYRLDVAEHITAVDPSHPVVAGVPALDLVDETYLCAVFEDSVDPLLRTDATIDDTVHFSTEEAMAGRKFSRGSWRHPAGSALAGWTKRSGRSRVVYLQPGDTGETLNHSGYLALVANALAWVGAGRSAG